MVQLSPTWLTPKSSLAINITYPPHTLNNCQVHAHVQTCGTVNITSSIMIKRTYHKDEFRLLLKRSSPPLTRKIMSTFYPKPLIDELALFFMCLDCLHSQQSIFNLVEDYLLWIFFGITLWNITRITSCLTCTFVT